MAWLQVSLITDSLQAEAIADRLSELGALSVSLEDAQDTPLYEPLPGETPLWATTRVIGLFEQDCAVESVKQQLTGVSLHDWRVEQVEDQCWERAWLDHFQPMRFGERLWVVPSHLSVDQEDAVCILLDPGLAFGTGTHPTTALCLEWLDHHDLQSATVIDYGCGSGILAIAALKLGAAQVQAVDIDPQALLATRDNAEKNGVATGVTTLYPAQLADMQVDILLANILMNPLLELAGIFAKHVRPGGAIVLSGILPEQAETVRNCYAAWFDMDDSVVMDGWIRLAGSRR